jgi:diguanylate cyclase (GGDEF)-like protein
MMSSVVAISIGLLVGCVAGFLVAWLPLKRDYDKEAERLRLRVESEANQRRSLQRTVEQLDLLKEANRQYVSFFVTIPEAIKRLSSLERKDDVCTAIIRLAKNLLNPDHVALFLMDADEKPIHLAFGFGLQKESTGAVRYAMGEGRVGAVADVKTLMTSEQLKTIEDPLYNDIGVSYGVPIQAGSRLVGALMLGPIPKPQEQDRRFAAMLGDLAAITFVNVERLESAQDEASIDPLTKLYNRRFFQDRLLEEKSKCLSYGSKFSIFLFDVDNFKNYNDTNGHSAGDVLLKALSDITKSSVRGSDIAARYGGEEFIVMFRDASSDRAFTMAEQLRQRIVEADLPFASKQPLGVLSISGGIATFPTNSDSTEEVIKLADQALYRAKKSGRNQIQVY